MSVFTAISKVVTVACPTTTPQHQRLSPPQHNVLSGRISLAGSEQVRASVAANHTALTAEEQIPFVDLSAVRAGSNAEARDAVETIAAACREYGFFQVTNHGVPMECIRKFRRQALALFALPPEQKDSISEIKGRAFGYEFRPNLGPTEVFQVNAWDKDEVVDFAHALFPDSSEDFVAILEEAETRLSNLGREILDILVQGLGVDAKHFEAHGKGSGSVFRTNYYHQSKTPDQLAFGLPSHVDGNLFTILHQQDVCGLEVLKDGDWIPISPREDAFCINVGDIMQVLSHGQYKSSQHRALLPKTQPRLSFAYFVIPATSTPLVPAPELVDSLHPLRYRPFAWEEFLEALQSPGGPYPTALPFFELKQAQS